MSFIDFPLLAILLDQFTLSSLSSPQSRMIDVGCGTSTTSAHFRELFSSLLPSSHPELWLLDKNKSWLEILEDSIVEELGSITDVVLYHADVLQPEQGTIINSQLALPASLQTPSSISSSSPSSIWNAHYFDLILLHSDMLGWFPFFETEVGAVARQLLHFLKPGGQLVVTRLHSQPIRSIEPLQPFWQLTKMLTILPPSSQSSQNYLITLYSSLPSTTLSETLTSSFKHAQINLSFLSSDQLVKEYRKQTNAHFQAMWFQPGEGSL